MKGDGVMKKKLCYLIPLIIMLLVSFSYTAVQAAPDDENRNSLTIFFYVQINGVDTPLPGAEVGICRVAELEIDENQHAAYTLLPEYEKLKKYEGSRDVTFDGLSVSESVELAQALAAYSPAVEQQAVTDQNGEAVFSDLEQGMYLVRELKAEGKSAEYELFEPYLISVPIYMAEAEPYGWLEDVLSEPKTVVKRIPEASQPSQTSEISKTSEPLEPAESSKPTESSQPAESSKPGESSGPAGSSQSESSEPLQSSKSSWVESSRPSQRTEPPESTISAPSEVSSPGESFLTGSSSVPFLVAAVVFGVSIVLMVVFGKKHRGEG